MDLEKEFLNFVRKFFFSFLGMTSFDLVIDDRENVVLEQLHLSEENKACLWQVVKEHRYLPELQKYGLGVANKILFYGASGCGKTATAKAIAQALDRSILILNLTNFICSKIGETGRNLKAIFDKAEREKAVLFLDEFDQVAKMRGSDDKDVGEMRRLVNTLIQLIDYFPKDGLLIAATNHPEIVDVALMRRFELKLEYRLPTQEQLEIYYNELLSSFPERFRNIERKYNISYAEAKDIVHTEMKRLIIDELEKS